jgi:hypothetical protein
MNLKLATLSDMDTVLSLVRVFVSQGPYKDEEYSEEKVREVVRSMLRDKNKGIVILLMKDDVPIGFPGIHRG